MTSERKQQLLVIERAAKDWIHAEFAFRAGRWAFSSQVSADILKAEDALRKAVTGKRLLDNAKRVLERERKAT